MGEHAATIDRGDRAVRAAAASALLLLAPALLGAQEVPSLPREGSAPAELPFAVGERLAFRVHVARLGDVGRGAMWIEGPAEVRGQLAYRLRFEFGTRVGPVKVENRTESWLDPERMTTLRFQKHERQPLSKHDQRVELFPDQRRWEDAKGGAGEIATDLPLDELSFIYFLRTLPLPADTAFRLDRHFEAARNPTVIRVAGRETVTTPAGEFRTVVVEMRVRDGRRYKGDGVIRLNLTDDAARLPVRIQSQMPVVGAAVLTLESVTRPAAPRILARAP